MRIGGLASGMDIDSLVGDLMKAERIPLDKLKQQKQTLEWQRDEYRSMNNLLLNFRNELGNMKFTSNYRARSVTSTNSDLVTATASSAASKASYEIKDITSLAKAATKVSGSLSGSMTNKIEPAQSIKSQSAKFADSSLTWSEGYVGSQTLKGDGTIKDFKLTLTDGEKVNTNEAANMSVKVNGKFYTVLKQTDPATVPGENQVMIDADGNLLFKDAIAKDATIKVDYVLDSKIETKKLTESTGEWKLGNTDLSYLELDVSIGAETKKYTPVATAEAGVYSLENAGVKIGTINYKTGTVTFEPSLETGTEIKVSYKQEYTAFNLTTQTSKGEVKENFLIKATESLNQVINKVNSSGAGITMFYDSYADKVSLTRTETGDFLNGGTLSEDPAGKINQIATSGDFTSKFLQLGTASVNGENAVFTINGMETRRSSNTFEMTGVTFILKKTTGTGETAALSVNNDTNKVFDNIKAFVDKYNELVDKIQKKTNEQYYRDYKPLTDEQREVLSDKQQEQWEEKAKSGLLKRDPILTQVLGSMRSDFYAPVENANVDSLFKQLASIGITTTAVYQDGGKLEIKDDVLKKAIEDNPETVENFFRGTGNTKAEQGVIQRLYDTVTGSMEKLRERAGSTNSTNKQFTLGRQLDNVYSQIDRFENRLTQVEDRYWRQFTAMEKAIQRSNEQAMYLMQQFSM